MNLQDELNQLTAAALGVQGVSPAILKQAVAVQNIGLTKSDIRLAAELGKTAFHVAGEHTGGEYSVFSFMARNPTVDIGQVKFAQAVFSALGRIVGSDLYKKAEASGSSFGALVGMGPAVVSEGARLTALIGLLGGSALGGGLWAVNRGVTDENEKNRKLELQRDTYHRLAAEVRDELKRRKLEPTPANTASVTDFLT